MDHHEECVYCKWRMSCPEETGKTYLTKKRVALRGKKGTRIIQCHGSQRKRTFCLFVEFMVEKYKY